VNVEPSLGALIGAVLAMAAIAPLAYRRWPRGTCHAAVLVSAACFAVLLSQLGAIARGEAIAEVVPWVPSLEISAALRLDGLSAVFALLITGIGAIVLGHGPPYLGWDARGGRLLGLLLAFEASMLGLVLADDTITLFVFWVLTSFTSFFLVAFDSSSELARTRARQALVITAGGGLVLLVGLLLLAGAAAPAGPGIAARLSELAGQPLREHPHYTAIVILIAIGAFTKSAQVPFHFWLPGAMVAPSPVSAYLHSATMVKAGVYLLARLHPGLGGTALWIGLLVAVGATTLVAGAVLATVQRDVKLTLAYATVAVLGALTLLLGIGTPYALGGAIVLLIAHACYKAALFLTAGNLGHHRGTRDPLAPPGASRDMPVTAATAAVAAASMAGIPPLLGFIAKDAVLAATVEGAAAVIVTIAAVAAGAGLVVAAWLAGLAPYLRGRARWARADVPGVLLVGPAVLAGMSLVLGLAPGLIGGTVVAPALAAVAGRPVAYEVVLWPGLGGSM
jgi:multicomponent Na+:H+ antiporter subunit A